MDVGAAILSAALSLVGKLAYNYITTGRVRVPLDQARKDLEQAASNEADRIRVHPDDLRRQSESVFQQLVTRSPDITFIKAPFRQTQLCLDYDPRNPESGKRLLESLDASLQQIALGDAQSTSVMDYSDLPQGLTIAESGGISTDSADGQSDAEIRYIPGKNAQQVLNDLNARIQSVESARR